MCSKCLPPARTHDLRRSQYLSIAASITFLFRVNPSLYQASLRVIYVTNYKSLFCRRIATEHPKFYNLQVHFDEAYTIHLMQFSLVISHYNITFSLFRLSQGSVATLLRRDWLSSYRHMYRSSLNLTVKLHCWCFAKLQTKINWLLLMAQHVYCIYITNICYSRKRVKPPFR